MKNETELDDSERVLSAEEAFERGIIQEVNRLLLHPRGLHLLVSKAHYHLIETTDLDGYSYTFTEEDLVNVKKAADAFNLGMGERFMVRERLQGYHQQPLNEARATSAPRYALRCGAISPEDAVRLLKAKDSIWISPYSRKPMLPNEFVGGVSWVGLVNGQPRIEVTWATKGPPGSIGPFQKAALEGKARFVLRGNAHGEITHIRIVGDLERPETCGIA